MAKFALSEYQNYRPNIMMAPMVDIMFNVLLLFMCLSVFAQWETELNIIVPKAQESKEDFRNPGEIIINITQGGAVFVNQKKLSLAELRDMLKQVSSLFPNQAVIIRADRKTFHQYVVNVLDACAAADIANIAFSTVKEEK